MHYTTVEEIPVGEVVTASMFLVNKHPAIVLFDSVASHSFMSQALASRHDQKIVEVSRGGYSINSAGPLSLQIRWLEMCSSLYKGGSTQWI